VQVGYQALCPMESELLPRAQDPQERGSLGSRQGMSRFTGNLEWAPSIAARC
jgi:hypothetical protein